MYLLQIFSYKTIALKSVTYIYNIITIELEDLRKQELEEKKAVESKKKADEKKHESKEEKKNPADTLKTEKHEDPLPSKSLIKPLNNAKKEQLYVFF